MNEIFLDTETTGLSFNSGHKIVEIACIETKDLIGTGNVFHKLINPKRDVSDEAYKIHGFSTQFLIDKVASLCYNVATLNRKRKLMKLLDFVYIGLGAVAFVLAIMTAIIGQGTVSILMIILGVVLCARTILS